MDDETTLRFSATIQCIADCKISRDGVAFIPDGMVLQVYAPNAPSWQEYNGSIGSLFDANGLNFLRLVPQPSVDAKAAWEKLKDSVAVRFESLDTVISTDDIKKAADTLGVSICDPEPDPMATLPQGIEESESGERTT